MLMLSVRARTRCVIEAMRWRALSGQASPGAPSPDRARRVRAGQPVWFFDPAADDQGSERDRQVSFDGVALAVVDRPRLLVVLGPARALALASNSWLTTAGTARQMG